MDGSDISGTVIDEDTMSYSNGISEISLSQFHKCILEGSKEMSKGGMQIKIINGRPIEVPAPNQREIFINSVKGMEDILIPEIENLEEFLKESNKIDENIKKMKQDYLSEYKQFKKENKSQSYDWDKVQDKYYDKIEVELVKFYREKLRLFSRVLKMLNYHKEGSI